MEAGGRWSVYRAHDRYSAEHWAAAEAIAARIHPNWNACAPYVRKLHTRNIFQVTGPLLNAPSKFVAYWAPEVNGAVQGGTRTAVMYARSLGIPTYNLADGVEAVWNEVGRC